MNFPKPVAHQIKLKDFKMLCHMAAVIRLKYENDEPIDPVLIYESLEEIIENSDVVFRGYFVKRY